ncbi:MAG TPA: hypothetical protein VGH17_06420 [Candidatus Acidoferrales bacterium]|jgi:hypothetical protein
MMENRNLVKCAEFEEILHELDRPGTKGNELREEALIHAESCGNCGVLLTETESLDFALKRITNGTDEESAPSRVETALLQEFRRVKRKSAQNQMQWRIVVIGVAAALFLVLGLSLQRHYAPPRGLGGAAEANMAKNAADSSTSVGAPAQNTIQHSTDQPSSESKLATPQVGAKVSNESDETELAENFTPLPYADDPSMMEGGSVVRVILSRSALASLGMPLSGAENREQIPADLVVSADGTPEAIRFIAQNVD